MDGSGLEVQVGWRWLPAFSMHSKLMPVPNGAQFRQQKREKDAQKKKLEGSLEKFLSKPENRETECQENVGVASTSAALNLEVMEVSEERNISPLEEDFSKTKTRESTAEEPQNDAKPTINTQICINLLNKLIDKFTEYRTDEHFERVLEEATNVARDLNVETDFPPIDTVRPRRKPTQFQYEQSDEVLLDPKTKYKETRVTGWAGLGAHIVLLGARGVLHNVPAVITPSSHVTKSLKDIPDSDNSVFHSAGETDEEGDIAKDQAIDWSSDEENENIDDNDKIYVND
ncbi:hypothetical protein EVAR_83784_1 [Eumeta japonica]|uniref:Uncharacterized protein n=1 Tax=Eumeta variegata TaxID=151549 RepID=A0A4C1WI99_EUMVA|nr:hypothetical protein EVAR_83784_1 [Eumeta japonica]